MSISPKIALLNKLKPSFNKDSIFYRGLNVALRLGALGLKLLLTLYLAKYFSLEDLGTFGLVTALIAISTSLLGFRLDYMVAREIVDQDPLQTARLIKDEILFYFLNYLLLISAIFLVCTFFQFELSYKIIGLTTLLACLESLCTFTSANFIFLRNPILFNLTFFLRSAAWVVPVMCLGFYDPKFMALDIVFIAWISGICLSLLITIVSQAKLPWIEALRTEIDWHRLQFFMRKSFLIWLGAIGSVGAGNIDRLVVEINLEREMVGILSFYGSFAGAVVALVASGVSAFKQPHLIANYRNNDTKSFWKASKEMVVESNCLAIFLVIAIGLLVPQVSKLLNKPEIIEHSYVLWIMLFGVLFKVCAENFNNILYAQEHDGPIWIGNILALFVALLFNIALVPSFGLEGAAYSFVLSSVSFAAWRLYWIWHFNARKAD